MKWVSLYRHLISFEGVGNNHQPKTNDLPIMMCHNDFNRNVAYCYRPHLAIYGDKKKKKKTINLHVNSTVW